MNASENSKCTTEKMNASEWELQVLSEDQLYYISGDKMSTTQKTSFQLFIGTWSYHKMHSYTLIKIKKQLLCGTSQRTTKPSLPLGILRSNKQQLSSE